MEKRSGARKVPSRDIYVITGAPGSGKTTLIKALRARGYRCVDEVAREIISEQLRIGGNVLPWIDLVSFGHALMDKRIRQYLEATEELHFFDRGIPDIIGYLLVEGKPVHDSLHHASKKYRYNRIVFFAEPWEEIYRTDAERKEPFESALKISEGIRKTYESLGYEVVSLPKAPVEVRVDFILRRLGAEKRPPKK